MRKKKYAKIKIMFTKINNKSPFKVKKEDLAKSASWNTVAQDRFKKQHEDPDNLPEGDHHAVPKHNFGPSVTTPNEQEMQSAVENLEAQIKQLQNIEHEKVTQKTAEQQTPKKKDDFYDDWLNE